MVYRLQDARTGAVLLLIPVPARAESEAAESDGRAARSLAARQARRHAAGGTWVLVTGCGKTYLYVGDRYFVPCPRCGRWMLPADTRRSEACAECRAADRVPAPALAAHAPQRRNAAPRKR